MSYLTRNVNFNLCDAGITYYIKPKDVIALTGLTGVYVANIYNSPDDNVSIVRNEELILIYAEANIGSNNAESVTAINVVRNAAGVGAYTGGTSDSELMDEIKMQRRYSLYGEAHRWIDMRRWGELDELPLDRPGDIVHVQFPRPFGE